MTSPSFAPGIVPPAPLQTRDFVLAPLGPEHNDRDHAAWMTSIDHIRSTPGFAPGSWGDGDWPVPMTLEENLRDLEMHAEEFRTGAAFAYTVLDPRSGDVIGCVYIHPDPTGAAGAMVRCWVRAGSADLDEQLAGALRDWIHGSWPLATARFPGRDG